MKNFDDSYELSEELKTRFIHFFDELKDISDKINKTLNDLKTLDLKNFKELELEISKVKDYENKVKEKIRRWLELHSSDERTKNQEDLFEEMNSVLKKYTEFYSKRIFSVEIDAIVSKVRQISCYIKNDKNNRVISYYNGKYKGELNNDRKKHGKGTFYCANGSKYEGEYQDDKINGKGTYYYADGDKYEGEFKNDKINGKGTYYFSSGSKYEGEFKDDKRNGKGIYHYADGNKYEGEFKDDKINGNGTFYWVDGNKYVGEWKDEKLDGKGIYYWHNGDKYEGEWKDGKRNGKGTKYWANGDKYEGEFKNDKINGKGTYYWADLIFFY